MGEVGLSDLMNLLMRPAVVETFVDILLCAFPIWLAVMIGLVIGWSWRPRWTALLFIGLRSKFRFLWTLAPPGFGARRLCLAFTALSPFSVMRTVFAGNVDLRVTVASACGGALATDDAGHDIFLIQSMNLWREMHMSLRMI